MTNPTPPSTQPPESNPQSSREPRTVLHRVCIQCNNMFRVKPQNYDAKQCPNCHKG